MSELEIELEISSLNDKTNILRVIGGLSVKSINADSFDKIKDQFKDIMYTFLNCDKARKLHHEINDDNKAINMDFSGDFRQNLNFSEYPIDQQRLLIQFDDYDWMNEDMMVKVKIEINDDLTNQWKFKNLGLKNINGIWQLIIEANRKPQFIIVRVLLPMLIITLFAFSSLFLNEDELGSRLSVLSTILLTQIAFFFLISTFMPRINYLSWIDINSLINITFTISLTIESIVVKFLPNNNIDQHFGTALISIWATTQIIWMIMMRKPKKLKIPSSLFQEIELG